MKKVVIFLMVLVVAVVAYGIYAYKTDKWPFTQSSNPGSSASGQPLEISKLSVDKEILSITLKKNVVDNGYCVLTLQSKRAALTIDDSKSKQDPKFKNCTGWTVGIKSLPAGSYIATVKSISSDKTYEASKAFDIN